MFADKLATLPSGQHLVVGIYNKLPKEALDREGALPANSSLTIICTKPYANSTPFRVPATDQRGTPRVCQLHVTSLGSEFAALKWAPTLAPTMASPPPTAVVRVVVYKDYVSEASWNKNAPNMTATTQKWGRSLNLREQGIFVPRRIGENLGRGINVRLSPADADTLEKATGVGGFLARRLPDDPAARSHGQVEFITREKTRRVPTTYGEFAYLLKELLLAAEGLPSLPLALSASDAMTTRVPHAGLRRTSRRAQRKASSKAG